MNQSGVHWSLQASITGYRLGLVTSLVTFFFFNVNLFNVADSEVYDIVQGGAYVT